MAKRHDRLLKITELASAVGMTPRTLRYYEDEKLITPAAVDFDSNYRYYGAENVSRLLLLKKLRTAGLNMSELKAYLDGRLNMREKVKGVFAEIESTKRGLKALSAFGEQDEHLAEEEQLPAAPCVKVTAQIEKLSDIFGLIKEAVGECIRKRLHLNVERPFLISIAPLGADGTATAEGKDKLTADENTPTEQERNTVGDTSTEDTLQTYNRFPTAEDKLTTDENTATENARNTKGDTPTEDTLQIDNCFSTAEATLTAGKGNGYRGFFSAITPALATVFCFLQEEKKPSYAAAFSETDVLSAVCKNADDINETVARLADTAKEKGLIPSAAPFLVPVELHNPDSAFTVYLPIKLHA